MERPRASALLMSLRSIALSTLLSLSFLSCSSKDSVEEDRFFCLVGGTESMMETDQDFRPAFDAWIAEQQVEEVLTWFDGGAVFMKHEGDQRQIGPEEDFRPAPPREVRGTLEFAYATMKIPMEGGRVQLQPREEWEAEQALKASKE